VRDSRVRPDAADVADAERAAIEIGAASQPFTVDDILSMHDMLMSTSSLKEDRDRAGAFRMNQSLSAAPHRSTRSTWGHSTRGLAS
jgi:Fic family protein